MDYTPASQWRTLNWSTPSWIGRTSEIWLHHGAAGSPTLATLRAYERHHVSTNGWLALGYSWAVTADGIYEGRGWHRAGAHTRGRNDVSHAVLLVGDWSSATVPPQMVDMAAEVIRDGIDRGALTSDVTIGGHREAPGQSTACPGLGGMAAVRKIAAKARQPKEPDMDEQTLRRIVREEIDRASDSRNLGDDARRVRISLRALARASDVPVDVDGPADGSHVIA